MPSIFHAAKYSLIRIPPKQIDAAKSKYKSVSIKVGDKFYLIKVETRATALVGRVLDRNSFNHFGIVHVKFFKLDSFFVARKCFNLQF